MSLSKFNPQKMSDDHLLPATLLELGDTLNFIETRKHSLRSEIKASKTDAGVGKVSGLAGMAGGAGLLILSNPLGGLIIAGGTAAYVMAVFAQWLQTGKLQLMPLSSKTQADRDAELSGATETGNAYDVAAIHGARDSIREDAAYLSDREKIEYELLHFSPEGLLSAMNHVHPTQRWACYQFLVDAFLAGTIQSYFANPQALRDVLGSPQIYTSHLPEAAKRFPQYGLQSAGAIEGERARVAFQLAQIGNNTRLNAVEVQSHSQDARPTQTKDALSTLLASPYVSRAIFGAQRTGKSYLAAVASLELAKKGVNIFHINLMSYGDEDSQYWQHAKRSVRCDLPSLSISEGKPFIKNAIALVAEFVQTPNSLLIVDEWAYTASTVTPHRESLVGLLNDLASQIASLSSAGIKRQRGLWTIAPEFVAGALVPQGKAIKKLQLVYATIHPDRSVNWNGNQIGFSDELFQQIVNNFPIELPDSMQLPNCDRIVYINREWMPVGELPALPKLSSKPATVAPLIQPQKVEEHITYPISEIAAMRGIERPEIEVDDSLLINTANRPESLDNYPMIKAICLYLEGKEPRSLKQIADTMKACKKISDGDLQQRLGTAYTNYKEGVQKILFFGVTQKFIRQVSQDAFAVNY